MKWKKFSRQQTQKEEVASQNETLPVQEAELIPEETNTQLIVDVEQKADEKVEEQMEEKSEEKSETGKKFL